jgi:hypothetical protein
VSGGSVEKQHKQIDFAALLAVDNQHSFTYLPRTSVYVGMTKIAQSDQVF